MVYNTMNNKDIFERLKRLEKAVPWIKDTTPPSFDSTTICSMCGMKFKGVTGYVCTNLKCPTFFKATYK